MERQIEVLERLATTSPRQLCNEAKLERCRAMKDLRSCGRHVQHGLVNCGHACLCGECTQRCDVCPICRTPISKEHTSQALRLHDDCLDVGLLAQVRDDDLFQRDSQFLSIDVRRLFQFFDIALDHNLVSVICHYVTDVCLDETAVSSDPALSVLLDGTVVKEWCKKTFQVAKKLLKDTYKLGTAELAMGTRLEVLEKTSGKLQDMTTVLETLDTPAPEHYPEPLLDLKRLLEAIRRALQHLQIMIWAARNMFLEGFPQRYADFSKWRAAVRQRKQAAQERAWPDYAPGTGQLGAKPASPLFIEEAIVQLQQEMAEDAEGPAEALDLEMLRHGGLANPAFGKRREITLFAQTSTYPPDSIRAAIDNLFLDGGSDLFLAKKAIFLYYLFDRFWSKDDDQWQALIEDYVETFAIPRHFVRESFIFFLLDDDSADALQEVSRQLPDVVNQNIHPRVPRVLLERHQTEVALSLLRRTGQDGRLSTGAAPGSLFEAVTAVRVWLECGLLTEGYLQQGAHCSRVKAAAGKEAGQGVGPAADREKLEEYARHVEVLVGEFCWLCIRRGWVDRMLRLPWTEEEEQTVHRCLLSRAAQEPAGAAGSLLVVFYLQRCRYIHAQEVHKHLCEMEDLYCQQSQDEEKLHFIERAQEHRAALVNTSLELLTEAEKDKLSKKSEPSEAPSAGPFHLSEPMDTNSTASFTFSQAAPTASLSSPLFSAPPTSDGPLLGFGQPSISRSRSSEPRLESSEALPHVSSQARTRRAISGNQLGQASAGKGKEHVPAGTSLPDWQRANGSPMANGWAPPQYAPHAHAEPSPIMARKLSYDDEMGDGGPAPSVLEKEPSLSMADMVPDGPFEGPEPRLEFQSPLKRKGLGGLSEGLLGPGTGAGENGIGSRLGLAGAESGGKDTLNGDVFAAHSQNLGSQARGTGGRFQELLASQSRRTDILPSFTKDGFMSGGASGAGWTPTMPSGSGKPATGLWQAATANWSVTGLGASPSSGGKRRPEERDLAEHEMAGPHSQARDDGSGYGRSALGVDGPSTSGASNGWNSLGGAPSSPFQYGGSDIGFAGGGASSWQQPEKHESSSLSARQDSLLADPEKLRWRTDDEGDAGMVPVKNAVPSSNVRGGRRLRPLGPSRFFTGIG